LALMFFAVGILGITARSSYMQAEDSMTMPPLDEAGGGGGVAAEIVQTTLDHFGEPMIAGKTHSEILSMPSSTRCSWYKRILPEEKREAMGIVDIAGRVKNSAANMGEKNHFFGKTHTEETRAKMSKPCPEETKTKISVAWTPEMRAKISALKTNRVVSEKTRAKLSAAHTGKTLSEEHKAKLTAGRMGENNANWQGGISFEPYCPAFNDRLKESIRNRDNRTCVLCGKSEIQNGERLSVHHIDGDKRQGCGKSWYLCALCRSCNVRPDTIEKEFLIVTGGSSVQ